MDWTAIGLNLLLIAGIIAATKVLTAVLDPYRRWERFYPLLPVLIAIPVAMAFFWQDGFRTIAVQAFIYGFIAGHAYKTSKTTILGQ